MYVFMCVSDCVMEFDICVNEVCRQMSKYVAKLDADSLIRHEYG